MLVRNDLKSNFKILLWFFKYLIMYFVKSKTCLYYITLKCNDTCEFCPLWNDEEAQKIKEAPIEKHCDNLKYSRLHGGDVLEVTGGEPLLYDNLPILLKKAKELGFKINLMTNGILYPERAQELKGLTDNIYFAIDYPDQEEHDRSRGVECFSEVLQSLKIAKELGDNPVIYFTVTRDSVRFLPEMVELAGRLDVKLEIHPVYDFQGLHGFAPQTYSHIKYYFKRKNIFVNLAELEFLKDHGNKPLFSRCRASQTTITFLPDGTLAEPCFFNKGGRQGKENVCYGCTRSPYMLPSFKVGVDKYRLLNWYSAYVQGRKEKE